MKRAKVDYKVFLAKTVATLESCLTACDEFASQFGAIGSEIYTIAFAEFKDYLAMKYVKPIDKELRVFLAE